MTPTSMNWRVVLPAWVGVLFLIVHFGFILISVAPPNPMSASPVDNMAHRYVDPIFTQDWKLFAPQPVDSDVRVYARGWVENFDKPWINLTDPLTEAVRGNPFTALTLPKIILSKNALSLLNRLVNQTHDESHRKALIEAWAYPQRKPAELVALERTACSILHSHYSATRLTHIQIMITVARPGSSASQAHFQVLFNQEPYVRVELL